MAVFRLQQCMDCFFSIKIEEYTLVKTLLN